MAKFSIAYVKSRPLLFGGIFLVFGVGLWLLLNRSAGASSGSGGGTTVVNQGPSDAAIAANVALQQTQISASTQVALAQLELAGHHEEVQNQVTLAGLALTQNMAQIQADHDLSQKQLEATLAGMTMQLANNLDMQHDSNQFMLDYAKNAQDAATSQLLIGANLQATLGQQQLEGFKFQAAASVIPTLKSKQRGAAYNGLLVFGGGDAAGIATAEKAMPKAGGGGFFSGLAKVISAAAPIAVAAI